jgi:hypothetical protein
MVHSHEIWYIEHKKFVYSRFTSDSIKRTFKLDLVGVQVRWEGSGTEPAREYTFFYGKGNENNELGTGFLCITESCKKLRGLSLLVTGCHT